MNRVIDPKQQELTELDTDCTGARDFGHAPQAYLILQLENGSQIIDLPVGEELVIGRGNDSSVTLDDSRVSRAHAKVFWESGELHLEDLESRNGTYLNGVRLRGSQLKKSLYGGDRVLLGSHEFVVALVSKQKPTAKPASGKGKGPTPPLLDEVVVADAKMTRTYGFAHRIAASSTTALILGETGSGKEVLVQQIHAWSRRSDGPLIRVNCAALPESLVESELFGHEKGAFTGATQRKIGFAEAADGGTLFLDEVGELSASAQAKLLTMLENRSVIRVGSTKETPIDIRVIAATHRDLRSEVDENNFREDLFYRLGVVILRVPPLRERRAEIPLLAELFARKFSTHSALPSGERHFTTEAMDVLQSHPFPGNIRELRNAVEHAMLVCDDGIIGREHLPETLQAQPVSKASPVSAQTGMRAQVADLERQAIVEVLRKKHGNRTHTAMELGVSLRSLLYKIKKYGITD